MNSNELNEMLGAAPEWHGRPNRESVAWTRWGKDHWSLLGYVESVVVDREGLITWDRLTLSRRHWPMLYAARNPYADLGGEDAAEKYGLRLKRELGEPVTLFGHCEGDALMDLVDAGLVTIEMPKRDAKGKHFLKPNGQPLTGDEYPSPKFLTGHGEWTLMPWAKFGLTELGWKVAGELREHKAQDGATWSNFTPTKMPVVEVAS